MVTPMEKLTPLTRLDADRKTKEVSPSGGDNPFASIFRSAINNVKETDAESKEAQYLLATGQLDNPAMAMIAGTKSAIAVDLLIQLRNKAQESFDQLTRIAL